MYTWICGCVIPHQQIRINTVHEGDIRADKMTRQPTVEEEKNLFKYITKCI